MAKCEDCNLEYSKFILDTIIPDNQWKIIHPKGDGGGILCANCMVKRASKIPNVTVAKMVFEFK